jgi:hypothetical protein
VLSLMELTLMRNMIPITLFLYGVIGWNSPSCAFSIQ